MPVAGNTPVLMPVCNPAFHPPPPARPLAIAPWMPLASARFGRFIFCGRASSIIRCMWQNFLPRTRGARQVVPLVFGYRHRAAWCALSILVFMRLKIFWFSSSNSSPFSANRGSCATHSLYAANASPNCLWKFLLDVAFPPHLPGRTMIRASSWPCSRCSNPQLPWMAFSPELPFRHCINRSSRLLALPGPKDPTKALITKVGIAASVASF